MIKITIKIERNKEKFKTNKLIKLILALQYLIVCYNNGENMTDDSSSVVIAGLNGVGN